MPLAGVCARGDGVIPFRSCVTKRPPKAGASPNGRRRLCGEAKRAGARAGSKVSVMVKPPVFAIFYLF
jgi:hypothetical protein